MRHSFILTSLLSAALFSCDEAHDASLEAEDRFGVIVPTPGPAGWGPTDERGNGNTQSYGTRLRCAAHLADPLARVYELSHEISPTMPQNIFSVAPIDIDFVPTNGVPFTSQIGNGEVVSGEIGQQGTQMDAIGHFGVLPSPWLPFVDPTPPVAGAHYYNGFTQAQVKPDPNGPLALLGIENAPPILTTAVVLDAEELLGAPMEAGDLVTAEMIDDMLDDRLATRFRGIKPGDAVYIRTGWGERWSDPQTDPSYYVGSPGLSADAVERLAEDFPVLVALDNAFTDAFQGLCELDGSCPPPDGSLPGIPLPAHHLDLVVHGIHQIQNMRLKEAADDDVVLGCTMVLPLPIRGGSGSPVRAVLIGR
jgi:kynurenine formamidase